MGRMHGADIRMRNYSKWIVKRIMPYLMSHACFYADDENEHPSTWIGWGKNSPMKMERSPDDDDFARFYNATKGELVNGDLLECCY